MQDLMNKVEKNTEVLQEIGILLKRFLEAEETRRLQSDWMDPEEAAQTLNLTVNQSRTHRRRLRRAADRYGIRVRDTRPPAYWREDILALSLKIRDGRAVI